MDAVKYQKEFDRMCDYYRKRSCDGCEIYKTAKECKKWIKEHPEQVVSFVERWSRDHPDKTCLDDFMEKYPKGVIAEETWCSLYNQGSVHRDGCRTDFCQDCFGWSEPAEKYL